MATKIPGLPIAHINIRGITNKIDELKHHIHNHHLGIIHVTETFLSNTIDSSLISIPDYKLVRRDRLDRHGGGVLTFIHSSINFSLLPELENLLPESLSIKITQTSAKPFITTVIYRPPNSTTVWSDKFSDYITKCKDICEEIIITGDFNINLNNTNRKWSDLLGQLGLLQLINQPTRVQANSQSLIDHVYVTKACNIASSGTLNIGLSDHDMIYASRKLGTKSAVPKQRTKLTYLDWKSFSTVAFQNTINDTNWDEIYLANNAESMLSRFTSKLQTIIAAHLKCKSRFVRSKILPPWLDNEIRQNIAKRDRFKQLGRWDDYKQQRNYTTNLIKKKKRKYVSNIISESDNKQTKHLWTVLRNSQKTCILPDPDLFSTTDHPDKPNNIALADAINSHFINITSTLVSVCPSVPNTTEPNPTKALNTTHMLNKVPLISRDEVILLFKDIKLNKATGIDKLSVRILRLALPFIINPITDILNRSITETTFPSQWKTAIVTPIHKGGDSNILSNYRPISVLPILSKIYEKHMLKSLVNHLDKHNIISDSQSGFRKQHSCTTTLHGLYSAWIDRLHQKHTLVLLFLDFQKAFDTVNHHILYNKLERIGITGSFLKTIQSYLTNRRQCVKIHNDCSDLLPVTSGVPQGSILSPTLFQIYINDLLSLPLHSTAHAYADDTSFFISGNDPAQLQAHLDHDISLIQDWCTANAMSLNIKKSHYLMINAPKTCSLTIKIHNYHLQRKTTSTLLGYSINDSLNWGDHIRHIQNKISSNLRLFYNIRHLMNFPVAKQFYYNFIHSYLIYGVHLYYPLSTATHTNPLFLLQKKALRLICKDAAKKYKHRMLPTALATTLTDILSLPKLSEYFASLTAFSIKNKTCPTYLSALFAIPHSTHSTRYQHKLPSSTSHNRLNLYIMNSFNSLPADLRGSPPTSFRLNLKRHLMDS